MDRLNVVKRHQTLAILAVLAVHTQEWEDDQEQPRTVETPGRNEDPPRSFTILMKALLDYVHVKSVKCYFIGIGTYHRHWINLYQ